MGSEPTAKASAQAKILFISVRAWGHAVQMIALAKEMQRRGHAVTFSVPSSVAHWVKEAGLSLAAWEAGPPPTGTWKITSSQPHWRTEKLLIGRHAERYKAWFLEMRRLIEREAPDLVVCNRVLMTAVDAADDLRVKCIVFSEFIGDAFRADLRDPQYCNPYGHEMSWRQRIDNSVEPILARLRVFNELRALERARRSMGLSASWTDIFYRHPVIIGYSQALDIPRLLPPSARVVGLVHDPAPEELPEDLSRWLDEGQDVVYIAQGTQAVHGPECLRNLRDGASRGEHKVLWSLPQYQREELEQRWPANIRLEAHVPQMAVLHHPRVKLFISHCGANSVGEALLAGKPVLCLPLYTDQHYNAARVVDRGIGLRINPDSSAEQIQTSVQRLLHEASFRHAAERLARIARNEGGLNAAADILESAVIDGYEHLLLPHVPMMHMGGTLMV